MKWVTLANGRSVAIPDDAPLPSRALNTEEPRPTIHPALEPNRGDTRPARANDEPQAVTLYVDEVQRLVVEQGLTDIEAEERIREEKRAKTRTLRAARRAESAEEKVARRMANGPDAKAIRADARRLAQIARGLQSKEWRGAEPLPDREVTGIGLCQGWRKGSAVAWIRKVA